MTFLYYVGEIVVFHLILRGICSFFSIGTMGIDLGFCKSGPFISLIRKQIYFVVGYLNLKFMATKVMMLLIHPHLNLNANQFVTFSC